MTESQPVLSNARLVLADRVIEAGWIAGDHILDTNFDLAKNIVNETLRFALRVDSLKIPAVLLRAYTAVELQGLAAANPSGLPSARQRREARTAAKERLVENQTARRALEKDVAMHQGRLSKFRDQMAAVKTNVEYQAMQKEVGFAQGEVKAIEDWTVDGSVQRNRMPT